MPAPLPYSELHALLPGLSVCLMIKLDTHPTSFTTSRRIITATLARIASLWSYLAVTLLDHNLSSASLQMIVLRGGLGRQAVNPLTQLLHLWVRA